jgi:deazaflavin-dependent oxidoreductase (nitroreductase family)
MTETRADTRADTRTSAPAGDPPGRRAPRIVRASNPLTSRLMRIGLPMGPNMLLTVRGRQSGLPRTVPVAVAEIDGRRYVIGAYGDVDWTRNLRAAGEATIRLDGRDVPVTAAELDPAAAREFFGVTLPGYILRLPWFGRAFAGVLFRLAAPDILRDAPKAAATRPVFELRS